MLSVDQQPLFFEPEPDPVTMVVCWEFQSNWADQLGISVFVDDGSEELFDTIWSLPVNGIICLCALSNLDPATNRHPSPDALISGVASASIAAETAKVPFLFLTPAGDKGTPGTKIGAEVLLAEDQVTSDQWVVRVNGVFGENVVNQVRRWVYSEILTVDDRQRVNPIAQGSLDRTLKTILDRGVGGGSLNVGGPTTSWYEFFLDAGIHRVKPWSNRKREHLFEWPKIGNEQSFVPSAVQHLKEWHSRIRA